MELWSGTRRWRYRRMAWKNDRALFMDMHPWVARLLDAAYESSWPLREWFSETMRAAQENRKIQAIRDVYGDTSLEVKHWKYLGSAADIYRDGRERGRTVMGG